MEPSFMELSSEEMELLKKHMSFYNELDHGKRKPETAAQRHFLEVCKGHAKPTTLHESAYLKHKTNLARHNEEKKIATTHDDPSPIEIRSDSSDMIPENEEGTPVEGWFTNADWKKSRARQYGDMKNNHQN